MIDVPDMQPNGKKYGWILPLALLANLLFYGALMVVL